MLKKHELVFILSFLTPTLALFGIFTLYPYFNGLKMSFYEWSGFSDVTTFVGLDNFKRMLDDDIIPMTLKHNLYIMLAVPIFSFIFALFNAVAISQFKLKESKWYRALLFVPYVLPVTITAILWQNMLGGDYGLVTSILGWFGIHLDYPLLGNPDTALWALCVPMIWSVVGFYMVLYLTAINNIDESLMEAASIDGASQWDKVRYITIPLIWETIRVTLVLFILGAFNYSFALPWIMTDGGPARSTEFIATYMYRVAQNDHEYGYATAIGVFIFIIATGLSLLSQILTRKSKLD
ncbi:carbohydrate ABC transporter permease [Cohnella sp. WQ 127256]|uniref:carbohydrate ABC transporter permease n=1 Tax=Cohnella sp. WQ 127256 TaxID=2938790 RepID=UPI00211813AA|nr:sugar ABC transporter permease [Cohnella sp. WQ 127256]